MYRDTIFTIIVHPEMYHDTVSPAVSSRFFLCSVFLRLNARFFCVWSFEHTCLSRCFVLRFTVESVQCGNESSGRHPVSLLVSTKLGTWFFPSLSTRLETWNSRGMYMDLSRGMKVNEFADLNHSISQVKPDSCFQSSDEGPLCCFV